MSARENIDFDSATINEFQFEDWVREGQGHVRVTALKKSGNETKKDLSRCFETIMNPGLFDKMEDKAVEILDALDKRGEIISDRKPLQEALLYTMLRQHQHGLYPRLKNFSELDALATDLNMRKDLWHDAHELGEYLTAGAQARGETARAQWVDCVARSGHGKSIGYPS